MKKVVLVTHEFGLLRNGGGIASYLYSYAKVLLRNYPDMHIYVLACHFHEKCDLVTSERFHVIKLKANKLSYLGKEVLGHLKKIKPDCVEVTDYLALCLESIVYKILGGKQLQDTVFMEYTHTASREIYEWGKGGDLSQASQRIKVPIVREWAQMALIDIVISPSRFLQEYVYRHYGILRPTYIPYIFDYEFHNRNSLSYQMNRLYDLTPFNDCFVISYISRFEGRKNQQLLVDVFLRFLKEISSDALLILVGNSMIDVTTNRNIMLNTFETIPQEYHKNFMFFEFATEIEKKKVFSVTDLSIMTSPYENFPFAMIETVCSGIPIMTSINCGCVDYMGKYGEKTAFDPFDEADLFHKVCEFYQMDNKQKEDIAGEQRCELQKLCSFENAVENKLELFQNVPKIDTKLQVPLICVYYSEQHQMVNIDEESNVLVLSEKYRTFDLSKLYKLINKVSEHPGKFAVSLGLDCLHTNIKETLKEEIPLLFTRVEPVQESTCSLVRRLADERYNEYLSIPVDEKDWC